MQNTDERQATTRLGELYPQLTGEGLKQAEENLDRYLELALRVYERVRHDPDAYSQFKTLTASMRGSTMGPQRSKPS